VGRPYTGRCNIHADVRGLVLLDAARINRINLVDEAVTIATMPPFTQVEPGDLVATVKIITFAVPGTVVERCRTLAIGGGERTGPVVRVAAYQPFKIGLLQTRLPGIKESVIDKTVEVTRSRLHMLGCTLARELRCGHSEDEVATSLAALRDEGIDIALVLGASAIVDRRDVVPMAVERGGGTVEHFGMPVDPGNLMLLASLGRMCILGLPGSARSIRLHGFDWVLQRLVAGLSVTGEDLMRMGVGGLLKEIPTRPMPRERAAPRPAAGPERNPRVGALILAAGQSRRMGSVNKLLADVEGRPMVARVADALLASRARPIVVVTGHQPERVREALAGRELRFVHNPDYAEGLSTSLRVGLAALGDIDGAAVCLGDMPDVTAAHVDRLIAAFDPASGHAICVPTFNGKRGNPVLWDRRFFKEMASVSGDVGARHLIGDHEDAVHEIAMPDSGVLNDFDTPEALAARKAAREAGA
jgi:molybdenum cofactor cytidylyltransferase